MNIKQKLFSSVKSFQESQIEIEEFCQKIIEIWAEHNDYIYLKKNEFDSKQNLSSIKWKDFYDSEFQELLDKIHSACYSYKAVPKETWEINENQLITEITNAINEYNISADL